MSLGTLLRSSRNIMVVLLIIIYCSFAVANGRLSINLSIKLSKFVGGNDRQASNENDLCQIFHLIR